MWAKLTVDWTFSLPHLYRKREPTNSTLTAKCQSKEQEKWGIEEKLEGGSRVGQGRRRGNQETTSCLAAKRPSVGFQLLFCCCQIFSSDMTNEETSGEVKYRSGERPVQCKHWVRPRSAQYSYLYDYRRNYYDDIIDYLDRRRRGIIRDIPRPQTWAERALRTYTQKLGTTENAIKARNDPDLIHRVHRSRVMHDYHTKDYYSKRFTMAVF